MLQFLKLQCGRKSLFSEPHFESHAYTEAHLLRYCVSSVSAPVELQAENSGSLEQGEQIRWQVQVPESGTFLTVEVDDGEVALYASTETTSPNEAYYQWKIQTSNTKSVFINPSSNSNSPQKRNTEASNETLVIVFIAILGLDGSNMFTLTASDDAPPTTELVTESPTTIFTTYPESVETTNGRLCNYNVCITRKLNQFSCTFRCTSSIHCCNSPYCCSIDLKFLLLLLLTMLLMY